MGIVTRRAFETRRLQKERAREREREKREERVFDIFSSFKMDSPFSPAVVSIFIPATTILAVFFATVLWYRVSLVKVRDDEEGTSESLLEAGVGADATVAAKVADIQDAITDGAVGFLATEYKYIFYFMTAFSAVIFVLLGSQDGFKTSYTTDVDGRPKAPGLFVALFSTISFILGATTSSLSGYLGMMIATYANGRTALEARKGVAPAFMTAFRSGAVMGFLLSGLGLMILFMAIVGFKLLYFKDDWEGLYECITGYGLGGSTIALFGRLGGGIFTKAADVGADLVGKVEKDIPEDDPRNPAVVADLVGDNVGDCAARGADLFESIAAEIISAMILGATMVKRSDMSVAEAKGFVLFPLAVHAMDCFASAIGILSVSDVEPRYKQEPYSVLKKGYNVALGIAIVCFGIACRCMLFTEKAEDAWKYFYACGLVGIVCGYVFVFIAQFYTDYAFSPVRKIAEASTTGSGTNVIAGVGVGLEATAAPVIVVSFAVVAAYLLGQNAGLVDESSDEPIGGLFGTAVATMGMLSTAAYVLTMDVFGPIADNAGGIVEMSNQPDSVRDICDELDAVGNTTKATTKGYAIGSAALASFLLFSAFMDEVSAFTGKPFDQVDIAIPEVFVGGLLGAALVYLFSAWSITAVGRSAQEVVREVRRQFAENPGIMTYDTKPDYERCVSIVAKSALRGMVKPGIIAVSGPLITGVIFRRIGIATGRELLGAKCVASFLMFATASGILMALFLNTAGGAWDDAKKYVETGFGGGKGSETHKAAVTGDTVGDPFKDTAGPSIHVLIKMLATITLVAAPMFLD